MLSALRTVTPRRALGVVGTAAALVAAFTGGVVAGAGSEPDASYRPVASGTGVLDDAAAQIAGQALHPVDREALDAAAIAGMLRAAGDEWGSWSDGSDPAATAGSAGIGVWLRTDRAGHVVVARVGDNSAAQRAGMRPGDEVRAVDGRTTRGLVAPVVALALRGAPASRVSLLTARGATLRSVVLVRTTLPVVGVQLAMERTGPLGEPVGRIAIPSFTRGTGRDVRAALARLRAAHSAGVILDLRGNPGGLLDEAVEVASAFLKGGPVVSYTRRGSAPVRLDAVGRGDTRTPLVVLVDGGTASAAEVVAGALQDRDRAVVVGSRTFGKGTVQEPRTLANGSALELTVARYALPSGRSVEGRGLTPDIDIAPGSPPDVARNRALVVLSGLVADTAGVAGGRG